MDKCAEMIMNRSQICFLCLGERKKSVSWQGNESTCFCKGGNLGAWGSGVLSQKQHGKYKLKGKCKERK